MRIKIKEIRKIVVVGFLLCLTVLFCGTLVWRVEDSFKKRIWNSKDDFSIVFGLEDKTVVLGLFPSRSQISTLIIPNDVSIEVFGGYGDYQLKKIPLLADQEKKPRLFLVSVSHYFGIPLEEQCLLEDLKWDDCCKEENTQCLRKLSRRFLKGGDKNCRLSALDRVSLWRFFFKRELLAFFFDVGEEGFISKEEVKKLFFDPNVSRENLSIAVLNSSGNQGLAGKVAEIVNNIGGRTVLVDNSEEGEGESCLIETLPKNFRTHTVLRLKKLFNCKLINKFVSDEINKFDSDEINKFVSDEIKKETMDVDIKIYLGQKYFSISD